MNTLKPFQIKKILIPIDFSDTSRLALEHAASICKKFDSELHLLHVYTGSYANVLPNLTATDANISNSEKSKEIIREELDAIGREFQERYNIAYNIELRDGSIAKDITEVASEVEASMIVMGTHGISGFQEFFLGSNAFRVVTSTSVPILTVQTNNDKLGYQNIALPIDSSKHTRDKVMHAATIAMAFDAKIHIAALITEEHEDEKNIFNLKIKQIEEYLDDNGVSYERHILHGDNAGEMTIKFSKDINADLAIVMTEQEPATGLFMGRNAQRVVNHSTIPILSVTPFEIIETFGQSNLGGDYKPFYI